MIRESQKRPKKIRLWENSQTDIGIRESQISCEIGGESVSIHPAGAYADEDKPFAGSDINTQINGIWQYQRGDTKPVYCRRHLDVHIRRTYPQDHHGLVLYIGDSCRRTIQIMVYTDINLMSQNEGRSIYSQQAQ
jgi:hypothetical protein